MSRQKDKPRAQDAQMVAQAACCPFAWRARKAPGCTAGHAARLAAMADVATLDRDSRGLCWGAAKGSASFAGERRVDNPPSIPFLQWIAAKADALGPIRPIRPIRRDALRLAKTRLGFLRGSRAIAGAASHRSRAIPERCRWAAVGFPGRCGPRTPPRCRAGRTEYRRGTRC